MCGKLKKHKKLHEAGPYYGSVRAHTVSFAIPQCLGSLWNTSRTLKLSKIPKNHRFGCLGLWGEHSPMGDAAKTEPMPGKFDEY